MTFLAPLMLFGAAAAAVPVVLHFFYRSRYRIVPWAAMKFLRQSIEQTSRRLRFQELVLLLLRILVMVLLAAALARPASRALSGAGGRGDAVNAVLLLDTSTSMAARDGEVSRIDRARAAALSVIDQLPANSTVQIYSISDRATLLGPKSPGNLDQARQILKSVEAGNRATDFLPGVIEAEAAFERGTAPARELYLFSDMQKLGWDRQASALKTRLDDLRKRAAVFLVRCGTRTVRNASVVGITPQTSLPHTGTRTAFAVLVRNSGPEPIRDLSVTLEADGKAVEKESQPIP